MEAVEELLRGSGSVVAELSLAVLESTVPSSTEAERRATTVKVATAPAAGVGKPSLMVLPVPPRVKAGPQVWLWETQRVTVRVA